MKINYKLRGPINNHSSIGPPIDSKQSVNFLCLILIFLGLMFLLHTTGLVIFLEDNIISLHIFTRQKGHKGYLSF